MPTRPVLSCRRADRTWETPFAVTRPVFIALAGLVLVGMAAVLGGAAVREHLDHGFRPDWAVWAPVTVGIGLGILGLGSLAMLAQRLPPTPIPSAGPLPREVAPGTERALLRGEALTPEQWGSVQQVVDGVADRRRYGNYFLGPVWLLLGTLQVVAGRGSTGAVWLALGGLMTLVVAWQELRRRRLLRRAAALGVSRSTTSGP